MDGYEAMKIIRGIEVPEGIRSAGIGRAFFAAFFIIFVDKIKNISPYATFINTDML